MFKFVLGFALFSCNIICLAQDQPHTILWEVSKPGLPYKSYLFGTFHEVNSKFFLTLDNTLRKLAAASRVYVEQQYGKESDIRAAVSEKLLGWNPLKWNHVLDDKQRKVFEAFVARSEDSSHYLKPPAIQQLSLTRLYLQNFCDAEDRDSDELMDSYIEKLARSKNKNIISLDTDQVDILAASFSNKDTTGESGYVDNVINLMERMLTDDRSACDLVTNYKKFEIQYELEKVLVTKNDPVQLLERNQKWMLELNKAFRETNCFVAVGFRHLMYKQGLVQALRDAGFSVTAVSTK